MFPAVPDHFPSPPLCRWIRWESYNGLKGVKMLGEVGTLPATGTIIISLQELDQDSLISRWLGRLPASTWTSVTVSPLCGW